MSKKSGFVGALLGGSTELYIAIAVVLMVFMLIFPLPTMVLDFLMVCNIVLSLIILLSVLYLKRPIDFGTFPTMLLISTVFSFALNVSSTRSILTLGPDFDGQMIRAFSSFVVGGAEGTTGLVVGFVIFIITNLFSISYSRKILGTYLNITAVLSVPYLLICLFQVFMALCGNFVFPTLKYWLILSFFILMTFFFYLCGYRIHPFTSSTASPATWISKKEAILSRQTG